MIYSILRPVGTFLSFSFNDKKVKLMSGKRWYYFWTHETISGLYCAKVAFVLRQRKNWRNEIAFVDERLQDTDILVQQTDPLAVALRRYQKRKRILFSHIFNHNVSVLSCEITISGLCYRASLYCIDLDASRGWWNQPSLASALLYETQGFLVSCPYLVEMIS